MTEAAVRVLIVDDEPHARAGIAAMLAGVPGFATAGEAGDGPSAVRAIRELRPDLVLLDVQMPEMSGFDVIREIGAERMPPVIFVTAFDSFALDAFTVHALDYLLKPFSDRRFIDALDRARETIRTAAFGTLGRRLMGLVADLPLAAPALSPAATERWVQRLVVRGTGRMAIVQTSEIDWIEGAGYYARLHAGGRSHLLRETMGSLETRLDPARFFRVHRSAIVNVDRIREVKQGPEGEQLVVLRDGTRVKMSRKRWCVFAEMMETR